jgi:hypothetical protein
MLALNGVCGLIFINPAREGGGQPDVRSPILQGLIMINLSLSRSVQSGVY